MTTLIIFALTDVNFWNRSNAFLGLGRVKDDVIVLKLA